MSKTLSVDVSRCTGCDSCVVSCSFKHTGAFSLNARVQVEKIKEEGLFVPVMCQHCGNAPCVTVCPSGALVKNPDTGETKLLSNKCLGCKMCLQVCPFGAITYNEKAGYMEKCDLCGGNPLCAQVCIPAAIRFIEVNEAAQTKRSLIAGKHLAALQTAVEEG